MTTRSQLQNDEIKGDRIKVDEYLKWEDKCFLLTHEKK